MIFPLAAAALTVLLDGVPLRSYNKPYIAGGHVMAPLEPYVTALAASIEFDGRALIVRRGDIFAQLPMSAAPDPERYESTYVEFAPLARTLGLRVRFDARTRTLYVHTPRAAFATPTPFNPAVPHVLPSAVFTPTPAVTRAAEGQRDAAPAPDSAACAIAAKSRSPRPRSLAARSALSTAAITGSSSFPAERSINSASLRAMSSVQVGS